jgi:hypothetical protein
LNQKLFSYISKMNPALFSEFFEERKKAEVMFDEAIKALK